SSIISLPAIYSLLTTLDEAKRNKCITEKERSLVYALLGPREDQMVVNECIPHGLAVATNKEFWSRTRQHILLIWEDCKLLANDAEKTFILRIRSSPFI